MNHWRCPPSNPRNERRYKVVASKKIKNYGIEVEIPLGRGSKYFISHFVSQRNPINDGIYVAPIPAEAKSASTHVYKEWSIVCSWTSTLEAPKSTPKLALDGMTQYLIGESREQRWNKVLTRTFTCERVHVEISLTSQMFNENFYGWMFAYSILFTAAAASKLKNESIEWMAIHSARGIGKSFRKKEEKGYRKFVVVVTERS